MSQPRHPRPERAGVSRRRTIRQHGSMLTIMKVGAHLPRVIWRPLSELTLRMMTVNPPRHMRQWQLNYQVVTGHRANRRLTLQAFRSWLENVMISLQIGRWSDQRIRSSVVLENPEGWQRLKDEHDKGGVVAALPHMGSWDLVGAFACLEGLPVSSVAEALPDGQFEYFKAIRERLGFTIYNVKDRTVFTHLREDLDKGKVICLVADRDFSRRGLPVTWELNGQSYSLTMPPGPALLAQQKHCPLLGVVTWFDNSSTLHVYVSEPTMVDHGEEGLIAATQHIAEFFTTNIQAHPLDWHMLQRFFKGVSA